MIRVVLVSGPTIAANLMRAALRSTGIPFEEVVSGTPKGSVIRGKTQDRYPGLNLEASIAVLVIDDTVAMVATRNRRTEVDQIARLYTVLQPKPTEPETTFKVVRYDPDQELLTQHDG